MDEKQIHYTKKRVDETWKQEVSGKVPDQPSAAKLGLSFTSFITSLGFQALMFMGELKAPGSEQTEVNLNAAQETIDLLILLKEKTNRNLTREESALISSLIPDLQIKFVQHRAV